MIANCKFCKVKFEQKIFNYRYCEETPECKESGTEAKNILIKKAMEKVKVLKEKKSKDETKVLREKLKTLSDYEAEAKKSFQKYIRLRDSELECISCGTNTANEWHASHYFDCNKYSGLIFNEKNVHKACKQCNVFFHGNIPEYRKGLIKRYGLAYIEELESISNEKRIYKYTKEELIAKKLKYNILIKELK